MKTLTKYDILVVVSNRLYLVLVIGLHTRYGYRYLSTSRGAGNENKLSSVVDSEYSSIDPYLPREGPETYEQLYIANLLWMQYSYLSTSRGDGNSTGVDGLTGSSTGYSYLSTSRGAGNSFKPLFACLSAENIAPYLPRKGPETFRALSCEHCKWTCIDTYLPREGTKPH